ADERAAVQLRQWPHPVPAVLAAERADVRELHIAPGTDFLHEVGAVISGTDTLEDRFSGGIDRAQPTVIKVHASIGSDEAHIVGGEGREGLVQCLMRMDKGFV